MSKFCFYSAFILSLLTACNPTSEPIPFTEKYQLISVGYPNAQPYHDTAKVKVYGREIRDPFHKLETSSVLQSQWVKTQKSLTRNYFKNVPFREGIKKRLEELWDYEVYSSPQRKGGYYFFYKTNGKSKHSVLYRREGVDGLLELVLDPNEMNNTSYVAQSESVSNDGAYLAFQIRDKKDNTNQIVVLDIASGQMLRDTISGVKMSSIAWYNNGFFYSRFAVNDDGRNNKFHQVYYHRLGDLNSDDEFVFGDRYHPDWVFDLKVTEDERYLVLTATSGNSGNGLLVRDLTSDEPDFTYLVDNLKWNFEVIGNIGKELLVLTNYRSPMQRLAKVNPIRPEIASLQDIIPTKEDRLLDEVHLLGRKLVVKYLFRAATLLEIYDLDGQLQKEVELPKGGVVESITGTQSGSEAFFSCSSLIQPRSIYRLDLNDYTSEVYQAPDALWNPLDIQFEQVWFSSYDKRSIPMFIYHKKGIKLNGNNPAFLFCNGGFNDKLLPAFNPTDMHLITMILEQGGVCAIPYIRGGGEFGSNWHLAGTGKNKKNSFNDFLFAAQYLINKSYTSENKIAAYGEGHGGLVVGYAAIERPDMFGVVVPRRAILDLLKFKEYSPNDAWINEFGDPELRQNFDYLYAYSPVYRVESAQYPAVLMSTPLQDTEIAPFQSFKYATSLQVNQKGKAPILINIEDGEVDENSMPLIEKIETATDILSFIFYNLQQEALYE